ncbi:sulfite oxidase [Alkalihalobacillus sp. AL-G]|uniref:sulfite oxidase n=1 Tax=Alkalihalobacillus sp. AL-G TaxID=2926399 RepID=UPI00272AAE7B|nr:sulfite oxidase [Alkalihalobacillus sp. AL-G]WLD91648.1 sulfite oxidase [Alkalihalobacillus sp. AL-G]
MKFIPVVRPYLTTRSILPENQETPISFTEGELISDLLFYRRNHFAYPNFISNFYSIPISGAVGLPKSFTLQEILTLPAKTIKVVLECAGNKRAFFDPKVFGEQWEKGAISQGYWKGVPLRSLFQHTGLRESATEVVFEGYDFGKRKDSNSIHNFVRSLPIGKALHPDTIIAYEYNGKPIPFKHGYPFRLIVPEWYAMASVKWIKQLIVIKNKFTGPFQSVDYVYYPDKEKDDGKFPVTTMNVNSTIQKPLDMEILDTGSYEVKGIAWTGKGMIAKVEISMDGGENWNTCDFRANSSDKYGWVSWNYHWSIHQKGEYTIMVRATDSENRMQPETPLWNRKGYGYNAMDRIKVKVE